MKPELDWDTIQRVVQEMVDNPLPKEWQWFPWWKLSDEEQQRLLKSINPNLKWADLKKAMK